MSDKAKSTLITVEIEGLVNGKRKIAVSGAPEGEMPIVRTGTFPELHHLIDQVWIELQKRQPQVVTVKAEKKAAPKPAAKPSDPKSDSKDGEPDEAPDPVTATELEAEGDASEPPAEPEPLPVIEGDTTAQEQTTFLEGSNEPNSPT